MAFSVTRAVIKQLGRTDRQTVVVDRGGGFSNKRLPDAARILTMFITPARCGSRVDDEGIGRERGRGGGEDCRRASRGAS